jgi:hypothetical protein
MEKGACTQVGQRRQVIGIEQGEEVMGGQSAGNIGGNISAVRDDLMGVTEIEGWSNKFGGTWSCSGV